MFVCLGGFCSCGCRRIMPSLDSKFFRLNAWMNKRGEKRKVWKQILVHTNDMVGGGRTTTHHNHRHLPRHGCIHLINSCACRKKSSRVHVPFYFCCSFCSQIAIEVCGAHRWRKMCVFFQLRIYIFRNGWERDGGCREVEADGRLIAREGTNNDRTNVALSQRKKKCGKKKGTPTELNIWAESAK